MSDKPQKPQLNIPVVSGSFYWVRPYHGEEFEPAKCKERCGYNGLWFCFTDGSFMEVERAWEVEVALRFAPGQFDEKQIAYSAWLEGQNQALRIHDVAGQNEPLNTDLENEVFNNDKDWATNEDVDEHFRSV